MVCIIYRFDVLLKLLCLLQLDIAYGENLVDSKIKVWWKDDHKYVLYIFCYV